MRLMGTQIIACVFALALVGACAQSASNTGSSAGANSMPDRTEPVVGMPGAKVDGSASYRERMALPADAVFEATLEDVSRADAPAQVIGRVRIEPAGQPPFRFSIGYDPARIQARGAYVVRARISRAGQLLFTTDRHYPLPQAGDQVELMLVRAQQSQSVSTPGAIATLENTYWKLIREGGEAVTIAGEREPHLVLHSEDRRVAGSGGCNRLIGGYTLDGERLSFSQVAGTMMACPDGMQYENAFHDALKRAVSWKIEGERLELFDETGVSVAQFESRYMR